jgi:hypothetical protein
MTARALLEQLRDQGARVWANANALEIDAPVGLLSPELRAELKAAKGELLQVLREERGGPESASPIEVRQQIGAVLIRSPRFGEVWLALDVCMADQLRAEEGQLSEPRPVLNTADLAHLEGKPPAMVEAMLNTLTAFPDSRWCNERPMALEGEDQ